LQTLLIDVQTLVPFDSSPKTLTAKEHRPAYTTDGDYFSKPSAEDIFDIVYGMMKEAVPEKYDNI